MILFCLIILILLVMIIIYSLGVQKEINDLKTEVIYYKELFNKTKEERDELLKSQKINMKKL